MLIAVALWAAEAPVYRVAPLGMGLRAATAIGPRRAGSLCLPAGTIAWRDAKPEEAEAREALAEGLRLGGLATPDPGNPFGDAAGTDRAIRADLHGLWLSACVPAGGLGRLLSRSQAIKGEGVIAVGWRAYARGQPGPTQQGEVCVAFSYREERASMPRMVLVGFRAAGARIASVLLGQTLPAADARCRRIEGAPLPD